MNDIPDDIWIHLVDKIPISRLILLTQTCKSLYFNSHINNLIENKFNDKIKEEKVIFYG